MNADPIGLWRGICSSRTKDDEKYAGSPIDTECSVNAMFWVLGYFIVMVVWIFVFSALVGDGNFDSTMIHYRCS